ncbi:hypothetical protein K435DRAFT_804295 [Dendrothele bispora CBS 962.96]|uniref:Uncharacterized protein n=1 Tax=Dendrothele bispora (strain CBS 962.96) TaxID=1314807 RepID=A0A4S8LG26_DENBC|nr:hypothetical protein K435DRAFT_804295 [Dendrothele bispora CBS 962.96]
MFPFSSSASTKRFDRNDPKSNLWYGMRQPPIIESLSSGPSISEDQGLKMRQEGFDRHYQTAQKLDKQLIEIKLKKNQFSSLRMDKSPRYQERELRRMMWREKESLSKKIDTLQRELLKLRGDAGVTERVLESTTEELRQTRDQLKNMQNQIQVHKNEKQTLEQLLSRKQGAEYTDHNTQCLMTLLHQFSGFQERQMDLCKEVALLSRRVADLLEDRRSPVVVLLKETPHEKALSPKIGSDWINSDAFALNLLLIQPYFHTTSR